MAAYFTSLLLAMVACESKKPKSQLGDGVIGTTLKVLSSGDLTGILEAVVPSLDLYGELASWLVHKPSDPGCSCDWYDDSLPGSLSPSGEYRYCDADEVSYGDVSLFWDVMDTFSPFTTDRCDLSSLPDKYAQTIVDKIQKGDGLEARLLYRLFVAYGEKWTKAFLQLLGCKSSGELFGKLQEALKEEIMQLCDEAEEDLSAYGLNFTTGTPTQPTHTPTNAPSTAPTGVPTQPSHTPTNAPSNAPTSSPTDDPTIDPTRDPSMDPTRDPTVDPTRDPTMDPTRDPTRDPTADPTADPTLDPTRDPTSDPTADPTRDPTVDPTADPTSEPSVDPTRDPTSDPTADPTRNPTVDPTDDPTRDPTRDPTSEPTVPSFAPTRDPTVEPTVDPTREPSADPTLNPSTSPTASTSAPSNAPTAEQNDPVTVLEDFIDIAGFANALSGGGGGALAEEDVTGETVSDKQLARMQDLAVSIAYSIRVCYGQKSGAVCFTDGIGFAVEPFQSDKANSLVFFASQFGFGTVDTKDKKAVGATVDLIVDIGFWKSIKAVEELANDAMMADLYGYGSKFELSGKSVTQRKTKQLLGVLFSAVIEPSPSCEEWTAEDNVPNAFLFLDFATIAKEVENNPPASASASETEASWLVGMADGVSKYRLWVVAVAAAALIIGVVVVWLCLVYRALDRKLVGVFAALQKGDEVEPLLS